MSDEVTPEQMAAIQEMESYLLNYMTASLQVMSEAATDKDWELISAGVGSIDGLIDVYKNVAAFLYPEIPAYNFMPEEKRETDAKAMVKAFADAVENICGLTVEHFRDIIKRCPVEPPRPEFVVPAPRQRY